MVSLSKAREEPVKQLWEEIDGVHAGMLGLSGTDMHMQPMAPFADPQANTIWFYVKKDSDLMQKLRPGARAHFCVIGKDHDYHACLSGTLTERKSKDKIDEYWSSVVDAWFEGGKEDPTLTMIALHIDDCEFWASTGNPLRFGWEIAKANLKDEAPDVGVHSKLSFA